MLFWMKDKGPILVLLLVAVGLGIALIVINKEAADQARDASASLATASNTVVSVKKEMNELQVVNQTLESNMAAARTDYSNKMALADANLRSTEADLEKAVAEAKAEGKALADSNAVALSERDQKISELESRNEAMDKETSSLHVALTNLDARIAATQEKLAKSEGNRDVLLNELMMLQLEKAEMESRFNDITEVRHQLRKLKAEAALARRLDSMRKGMYGSFKENSASSGANIELNQSGGVKIQTNSPGNAPPK
jgi:chromosome segregation ATPase